LGEKSKRSVLIDADCDREKFVLVSETGFFVFESTESKVQMRRKKTDEGMRRNKSIEERMCAGYTARENLSL
jgi:hypothetical protein